MHILYVMIVSVIGLDQTGKVLQALYTGLHATNSVSVYVDSCLAEWGAVVCPL